MSPTHHRSPDIAKASEEQLNAFYKWLDSDEEKAVETCLMIQNRLIRFFLCRGSSDPEGLSSDTIDRVVLKLPEIQAKYGDDPVKCFYGFAKNIFRESLRAENPPAKGFPEQAVRDENNDELKEERLDCLDQCMAQLSRDDRALLIGYYSRERGSKIKQRKEIAAAHGGENALRIWMCRKRKQLRECVKECLNKKSQSEEK